MQQNTPMKRQFTTIDGRTVMSNLPQHWGGNDWKITGVDNPLPVGNYVQTESGVWIPQKGSDDGAADVRLTGRNVEEIIFFDALAITDTSIYRSDLIDLSKYEKVLFVAINTHDQHINLWFQIAGGNVYFWDGSSYVNTLSRRIEVPSASQTNRIILNDAQPETLNKFYFDTVRWSARANDTPTSGSLTLKAWGVVS